MAKTGGVQKSKGRVELESLTDKKLLRLFNNNTIKEIANKFKIDPNAAGKVITSRLFTVGEPIPSIERDIVQPSTSEVEGAWMQSKERAYFQEYKEDIIRKVTQEKK